MENKINKTKINRYLVVSLHDVSPVFTSELKEVDRELEIQGVGKKSLIIVPFYEGNFDISREDNFLWWLQSLIKKGDEPVQHGYQHTLHKCNSAWEYFLSLYRRPINRKCAEFGNLKKEEAKEKIRKGRKILRRAGIHCRGFIAPWWAISSATNQALKEEGFEYTTSLFYLKDYRKELKVKSEVISSFQGWPDYGARIYNLTLNKIWLKKRKLARVAVHPLDIHRESSFLSILNIIKDLKKQRTLTTYIDYLDHYLSF